MSDARTDEKRRRDRRNGVIAAVVLIVGALLVTNAGSGDAAPTVPEYPVGAFAECDAFHDLEDRFGSGEDVTSAELTRALLDIAQAAEGGPVEAEATELLDALTSGDEARNHAAINAMRTACNSG